MNVWGEKERWVVGGKTGKEDERKGKEGNGYQILNQEQKWMNRKGGA